MQAKSLSSIVIWDYNGGDNQLWFWDPSNGHFLRNKAFPNKVQWIGFTPSSIFCIDRILFERSCAIMIQEQGIKF